MKVVIADRLAIYVDAVYNNYEMHSSYTLILASVFFAFQIYCDFGGYSNIAIGCAKVLGIDLMVNFKRPYFQNQFKNFGIGGIFHYLPGLKIMFIYPLVEIDMETEI